MKNVLEHNLKLFILFYLFCVWCSTCISFLHSPIFLLNLNSNAAESLNKLNCIQFRCNNYFLQFSCGCDLQSKEMGLDIIILPKEPN